MSVPRGLSALVSPLLWGNLATLAWRKVSETFDRHFNKLDDTSYIDIGFYVWVWHQYIMLLPWWHICNYREVLVMMAEAGFTLATRSTDINWRTIYLLTYWSQTHTVIIYYLKRIMSLHSTEYHINDWCNKCI